MPSIPAISGARLKNTVACLGISISLLNDLHDAFATPFVPAIVNTVSSLVLTVQNVTRNKDDCIGLTESIYGLIYAIVSLHLNSETTGSLSPAMMHHIGKFTVTLHKIHTYVEAQQSGSKIKHFFRQSEMNIEHAAWGMSRRIKGGSRRFSAIQTGFTVLANASGMQEKIESMHKELLELISTLSDEAASERSSLTYPRRNESQESSGSFSMLPSQPKIFHGRESELQSILELLHQDSARIAILGPGGMGKTSLARAALHHPDVVRKYDLRVFVACDSAGNSIELAALIGPYVGLEPAKDLRKPVVQLFATKRSCILFLDNLETPWETRNSRGGVEEFLSLLTDLPHLHLLITMRGTERPGKVQWTRPFLKPLKPLSQSAAHETFFDIVDESHDPKDVVQILNLTDNLPLAVNLIAHLVDYEGCSNVLARWELEKTSMLSGGYDRKSSLDASISISLSSPRVAPFSGAKDLLSLLTVLLGTSLAYIDVKKRLKSLVPIREHMLLLYPVPTPLIRALRQHFFFLLDLHSNRSATGTVDPIILNLGNIQNILRDGLNSDHPDIAETIRFTLLLNRFSRLSGRGRTVLMDLAPAVFPQPPDHRLQTQYITEQFASHSFHLIVNPDSLISRAKSSLEHIDDPIIHWKFHFTLAAYYTAHGGDLPKIMECVNKALEFSKHNIDKTATTLNLLAEIDFQFGSYGAGRIHAREAQRMAALAANLYEEANSFGSEALCLTALGDYKSSILRLQRAKDLMELCGMSAASDSILSSRAEVHLLKSEYAEARSVHVQLIDNTPQNNTYSHGFALLNLAEIDVLIGAYGDVLPNLDRATAIFQPTQDSFLIYSDMIRADFNLKTENKRDQQVVTYCLERLADISQWSTEDSDWVFACAVMYLVHAHRLKQKLDFHKALQSLGEMLIVTEDDETAHNLNGEIMLAAGLWREAQPLFEKSSQSRDVERVQSRLTLIGRPLVSAGEVDT
ncbi:hypothetical protein B0H14DRAFT_2848558 [Mycena olivaceomarginata]|nr:hypothetical protein B0H14DRAFT_2848558 [Mycena olivaceomarginata]